MKNSLFAPSWPPASLANVIITYASMAASCSLSPAGAIDGLEYPVDDRLRYTYSKCGAATCLSA